MAGPGWGGSKCPSDIILSRKLEISGASVAGVYTHGGAAKAPKPPRRSSKPRCLPRNLGGLGRCLLSDATVCNAVLGAEARVPHTRPADAHAQGALCPTPAAGSFSPDVPGGDGGGARGEETFGSLRLRSGLN